MPRKKQKPLEDNTLSRKEIKVTCSSEFFELISLLADRESKPLGQVVLEQAAAALGRDDLAEVPRKSWGRPRKTA